MWRWFLSSGQRQRCQFSDGEDLALLLLLLPLLPLHPLLHLLLLIRRRRRECWTKECSRIRSLTERGGGTKRLLLLPPPSSPPPLLLLLLHRSFQDGNSWCSSTSWRLVFILRQRHLTCIDELHRVFELNQRIGVYFPESASICLACNGHCWLQCLLFIIFTPGV